MTKPPKKRLRAYGYIRVSTDEQAREGVSLDAQRDKIRIYAELHDLELIEVFSDEGRSGKVLNRPALQKLLESIQGDAEDVVIVHKLDRLSRRTRDLLWLIEDVFRKEHTRLISLSEQIDTNTAMGKFFLTIMGALSQMERELVSERTRTALDFKRQRGDRLGTTPFGFLPGGGDFEPHAEEMGLVQRIVRLRRKGESFRAIAERLNQEGVPAKRGGRWHASTVRYIVANKRYADAERLLASVTPPP